MLRIEVRLLVFGVISHAVAPGKGTGRGGMIIATREASAGAVPVRYSEFVDSWHI